MKLFIAITLLSSVFLNAEPVVVEVKPVNMKIEWMGHVWKVKLLRHDESCKCFDDEAKKSWQLEGNQE